MTANHLQCDGGGVGLRERASTCGNGSGTYLKAGNFCFYGDGSAVGMYFGNSTQTYAQPISIDVVSMPCFQQLRALFSTLESAARLMIATDYTIILVSSLMPKQPRLFGRFSE